MAPQRNPCQELSSNTEMTGDKTRTPSRPRMAAAPASGHVRARPAEVAARSAKIARLPYRFSSSDLQDLLQQYQCAAAGSPWLGFGFSSSGGANPECIFLFTTSSRLELRCDECCTYRLLDDRGHLVWSAHSIKGLSAVLSTLANEPDLGPADATAPHNPV